MNLSQRGLADMQIMRLGIEGVDVGKENTNWEIVGRMNEFCVVIAA